ncbi:hypothetical protein P167DRAFT_294818 [Morchella conica CCBAS932]|uniref:Uncharacterized protein n=1 Tax=Morchella conica CCBAS932 TaxID=1392247 RepID=A0A3N4KGD3_9PEZI|nr:hypothetical protein P167DRAFT_294818 [Morchella conica CCBAS932]
MSLQWAHLVLQWVINDYKSGHISLTDNREKWYQGHVWTALFDRALETIPDLRIIR